MKAKRTVGLWILATLCCLATGASARSYTWTGNVSEVWDLAGNWVDLGCMGPSCLPHTKYDDAIFPADAGWTCDLITEKIDDLTIGDDVDFGAVDGTPVLKVDTLTINGPAVVTITDATIRTE